MYLCGGGGKYSWVQCPWRPQEGTRPRELELTCGCELPTWMLGTALRSHVRTMLTLNLCAIAPGPNPQCFSLNFALTLLHSGA